VLQLIHGLFKHIYFIISKSKLLGKPQSLFRFTACFLHCPRQSRGTPTLSAAPPLCCFFFFFFFSCSPSPFPWPSIHVDAAPNSTIPAPTLVGSGTAALQYLRQWMLLLMLSAGRTSDTPFRCVASRSTPRSLALAHDALVLRKSHLHPTLPVVALRAVHPSLQKQRRLHHQHPLL